MKRPYIRVTPGEAASVPADIPETLASLHKLGRREPDSVLHRLNPFDGQGPLRFEFVAISDGEGEPAEFYYGADDHIDALEQRLRSIYPSSYDIDQVETDLTGKLLQPVEYTRDEFTSRLEDGRLYDDTPGSLTDVRDFSCSSTGAESRTDLEKPVETSDGHILARPPLSEVEPYGVEWWVTAERRKDWMTTLTGYTELRGQHGELDDDRIGLARHPLVPLVEALVEVDQPVAFQVVFQRKSDWSRAARRRSGELLDGSDTLLQKLLGLESPGPRRASASGRSTRSSHQGSNQPLASGRQGSQSPRLPGVKQVSRLDEIRANDPKRTFSANVRLLSLQPDQDDDELRQVLEPLRSVFDLVDGEFYEIDGRRLRSHGRLPGAGERHARKVVDDFAKRSMVTGGRSVSVTNRRETRPDLVLNADELANFVIIPAATELPSPRQEDIGESWVDAVTSSPTSAEGPPTEPEDVEVDVHGSDNSDGAFPTVPDTVLHRDDEVSQITGVLEPLARGQPADTILVTGLTGTGKTCIATLAVDCFRQENPVIGVYVNCWEDRSRFKVLYRILDQLESTIDIHRQSTPRDVLLERLRGYDGPPCVVILDEVDQLEDRELLYDLLNLQSLTLLLIVNREADLLEGLDDRLSSRLQGCERIHCQTYSEDELVDILQTWSDQELAVIEVKESGLTEIASMADGDARVAITTLRIAARRAEQSTANRIDTDLVEDALPEARREVRETHIENLTSHQQAVFEIVDEEGSITPGDLYKEYQGRVEEPKSDRTVRNYLDKLENYGLIEVEGSTRDRIYRGIGTGARGTKYH